jgi:hypothetical protein
MPEINRRSLKEINVYGFGFVPTETQQNRSETVDRLRFTRVSRARASGVTSASVAPRDR